MNTYTPTHTARPSRLRIARALLLSWYDEHAHALALSYVAVIVATFAAITAVAMRADMGASMSHAVSVAVLIVGIALFASMLAYMLATSRAEDRERAYWSPKYARLSASHEMVVIERDALVEEMDYLATHR
jgi:hypothetical protein